MNKIYSRALLAIAMVVLVCVSCGRQAKTPSTEQEEKKVQEVGSPKPALSDSKQAPKEEHPVTAAVPKAYFGELGLSRLAGPTKIEVEDKSSVILIIIDALNAKHLGVYGYERPSSPNLDALAKRGYLLSNHVSNSSWTRPSFTTIITGLPKKDHGVELGGRRLEMDVTTLAERFRLKGYRTAGFVGNPLVRKIWGFGQGFQVYVDTKTLDKAFPPDAILVDRAIKWLNTTKDKPFFLMLFMTAPHVPYRPPTRHRKFLAQLPKGKVIQYPFKEYLKPLPKLDHDRMVAAYDGDVAYADEQVGRLVKYLDQSGLSERTAIVITADHGEVFGHHNCYVHAYHMWEPALRVPFILISRALGVSGVYDDRPSTHVDIVPTLLDLAGIGAPEDSVGISLLKRLNHVKSGHDRVLFSQYNAHGIRRQAIRKGRFKLVHHHKVDMVALAGLDRLHTNIPQPDPEDLPSLAVAAERYELYDLVADPKEDNNIITAHGQTKHLVELQDALKEHRTSKEAIRQLSEETLKALQAAGYIGK